MRERGAEYRRDGQVRVKALSEACAGLAASVVEQVSGRAGCDAGLVKTGPADIAIGTPGDRGSGLSWERGVQSCPEVARAGGYMLNVGDAGAVVAGFDEVGALWLTDLRKC